VPLEGTAPSVIDAFQLEIQAEPPERLKRRMTDLSAEAKRLLPQLVTAMPDFTFAEPGVSVECLAVPTATTGGGSVQMRSGSHPGD
jgi:hypothetical protein